MEAFDGSVLVPDCDHDGSLSDIEVSDGKVLLSSKDIAVQAVARSTNGVADHDADGGSVFLNEGVERGSVAALEQVSPTAWGAPAVSEVLSVSRKSKRTVRALNSLQPSSRSSIYAPPSTGWKTNRCRRGGKHKRLNICLQPTLLPYQT